MLPQESPWHHAQAPLLSQWRLLVRRWRSFSKQLLYRPVVAATVRHGLCAVPLLRLLRPQRFRPLWVVHISSRYLSRLAMCQVQEVCRWHHHHEGVSLRRVRRWLGQGQGGRPVGHGDGALNRHMHAHRFFAHCCACSALVARMRRAQQQTCRPLGHRDEMVSVGQLSGSSLSNQSPAGVGAAAVAGGVGRRPRMPSFS